MPIGPPPPGAWTALAQNPCLAGPIAEGDVIEFDLVWLDMQGVELRSERVVLAEDEAMPLPTLNAAMSRYTTALRKAAPPLV